MSPPNYAISQSDRRAFIGGSDARIIMGDDETALLRLWREKRGEVDACALNETLDPVLACGDAS